MLSRFLLFFAAGQNRVIHVECTIIHAVNFLQIMDAGSATSPTQWHTRQHPAGRVARSADSRSSYSVPLENLNLPFTNYLIFLQSIWTGPSQTSRRPRSRPAVKKLNPAAGPVTKLNLAAGHRAPPWPNSTQPPAIQPRRYPTQPSRRPPWYTHRVWMAPVSERKSVKTVPVDERELNRRPQRNSWREES